ncbi:unnamed protein product [Nezara viridula]|uniref:Uncharacterized protein n=1 Tax=Nezara viridula TaxID=85310 RepID=A0A9P0MPQ3_NEZVI|nr:unnamed protein product [Nezara viridula]
MVFRSLDSTSLTREQNQSRSIYLIFNITIQNIKTIWYVPGET